MKPITLVGALMMAIGIATLLFRSFSFTREEKVVDLGPLEVNREKRETVSLPTWAAGALIGVGGVLMIAGARKA